ncbi:hypothetical protein [Novosphingobium sp. MMS21-SN21R]|uniref:hypothetical protein n=1 Tax=Novosphingobium sp. MMS21-SN21R TaxID=2969298 RepID=UPI0028867321|nr:hypothetical protein [Novosphingobium sp. MMS21-SN21R]MDT0507547.1 hypothetical protein [Novosphingobium sp. MMS21-SN21R]MDT0509518.1 hypothetical protein [Novosphingobium sp. MMS21-SN21R]
MSSELTSVSAACAANAMNAVSATPAAEQIAALQAQLAGMTHQRDHYAEQVSHLTVKLSVVEAELAEAREVPGRIVDWLNSQPETLHHDDIATAIEARDWSK